MVDVEYARGWDDCLEAVNTILTKAKDMAEIKRKVRTLQELVKDKKFEKIRYDLGVFDVF